MSNEIIGEAATRWLPSHENPIMERSNQRVYDRVDIEILPYLAALHRMDQR
jgi:hypothetical protein